jgi:hypothetical protein
MGDWSLTSSMGQTPAWGSLPQRREDSFLNGWANRSALWGSRHGLGEAIDRYMGLYAAPGSTSASAERLAGLGLDDFASKGQKKLDYSSILRLDTQHVGWKELNWESFRNHVKANTYEFRESMSPSGLKSFFPGISFRDFRKDVLWKRNIEPIKALFSGSNQNFFMNLGYTAGLSLIGFNIFRTSKAAYQQGKAQEDGSWKSRLHTYGQTAKAFGQTAIQSAGAWIAADIGMTVGKALIPIGSFPIGGILVGALAATLAAKGLKKCFAERTSPVL